MQAPAKTSAKKPASAQRVVTPQEEKVRLERRAAWMSATHEFVTLLKENFEAELKIAKNRKRLAELSSKLPHLAALKGSFANAIYNQSEKSSKKSKSSGGKNEERKQDKQGKSKESAQSSFAVPSVKIPKKQKEKESDSTTASPSATPRDPAGDQASGMDA